MLKELLIIKSLNIFLMILKSNARKACCELFLAISRPLQSNPDSWTM